MTNYEITFPYLTILENILLSQKLYNISGEVNFEQLYTDSQLDTLAKDASLGMKLKVGLSLVSVKNYWDLIIIDETLANIDKTSKKTVIEYLHKRQKEGSIVFVVDHGLAENQRLGFKVIKVQEGRINV